MSLDPGTAGSSEAEESPFARVLRPEVGPRGSGRAPSAAENLDDGGQPLWMSVWPLWSSPQSPPVDLVISEKFADLMVIVGVGARSGVGGGNFG